MQDGFWYQAEVVAICGTFLASLVYAIVVCARDARRRGRSPLVVAMLVILFFPIGLVIWLAVRPAKLT
jgi:hypothetical protein